MLEALLIFPGLAVAGAAFAGWKASHPKLALWTEKRRSALNKKRRAHAVEAIWAQMPRYVMSIDDVRNYHDTHHAEFAPYSVAA